MVDRKCAGGTEGPAGVGIGERGASKPVGRPIGGSDRKRVGVVGDDDLKSCLEAPGELVRIRVWDRRGL